MSTTFRNAQLAMLGLVWLSAGVASAYNPVTPGDRLKPGQGLAIDPNAGLPLKYATPAQVWGKEYVNDYNVDGWSLAPLNDPEQIVLWDGQGGTTDGKDYTGVHPPGDYPTDQVDAIANSRDTLFPEVLRDETALAFSYNNEIYGTSFFGNSQPLYIPSGTTLNVAAGTLAGPGEVTVENNGTGQLRPWARQSDLDLRTGLPNDVAGLELWGPEWEDVEEHLYGDTEKYSLFNEEWTAGAVLNDNGSVYVSKNQIRNAVVTLLGPVPPEAMLAFGQGAGEEGLDVDALMVYDVQEDRGSFDACGGSCDLPTGFDQEGKSLAPLVGGDLGDPTNPVLVDDTIIFSIRQLPLPGGGYYATGSELFVLDASGNVSFLNHGGHVWDKAFAESQLVIEDTFFEETDTYVEHAVLDLNALDAIADIVYSIPGDANGDGGVDGDDLIAVQANFGMIAPGSGDADGDGDVDGDDLIAVQTNFGMTSSVSIPEPTGISLATLLLAGAYAARRRG